MTDTLFTPLKAGRIEMRNRVVMAPLTRNRAYQGDVPGDLHVEYYRQRAGAGLIVTEGSQISPQGKGYADTPGIYSDAQVAGWKKVTDAVHAKGGRIVIQLWHVGRISHPDLLNGGTPVAPSAIPAGSRTFVNGQFLETGAPRALSEAEIAEIVSHLGSGVVNKQSTTYRSFSPFLREAEAEAQIAAQPTVMKRPVIRDGARWHLGWDAAVQAELGV